MKKNPIKLWLNIEKEFEKDYNKASLALTNAINETIVNAKYSSPQEESKGLKLFIHDLELMSKDDGLKNSKAIKCFYEIIKEKQFALAKIF